MTPVSVQPTCVCQPTLRRMALARCRCQEALRRLREFQALSWLLPRRGHPLQRVFPYSPMNELSIVGGITHDDGRPILDVVEGVDVGSH